MSVSLVGKHPRQWILTGGSRFELEVVKSISDRDYRNFLIVSRFVVDGCDDKSKTRYKTRDFSTVLEILDIEHRLIQGIRMFGDILFANSIAPSTYLGGEPLAAYLLSRHSGINFENSLATVSSTDMLNYAPMVPLAGIGLLYFTTTAALGRHLELILIL